MNSKNLLQNLFRGWFPQEPALSVTRTTSSSSEQKIDSWVSCPFLVPGALMIFAALLSAYFGLTFVSWYFPEGAVIYIGFYLGIFSVVGFVLGLICGGLLLAGKRIHAAAAGSAVILCFGLATVALPTLIGYTWMGGLLVASPMIAFPVIALIQIGLNYRKLKAYNFINEPESTVEAEPKPINRKPIAAGLTAAGCGLILVGLGSYYLAPIWAKMVPGIIIVTGAGLIAAAYLERKTYKHGA